MKRSNFFITRYFFVRLRNVKFYFTYFFWRFDVREEDIVGVFVEVLLLDLVRDG
jgi:hypothetical protein